MYVYIATFRMPLRPSFGFMKSSQAPTGRKVDVFAFQMSASELYSNNNLRLMRLIERICKELDETIVNYI